MLEIQALILLLESVPRERENGKKRDVKIASTTAEKKNTLSQEPSLSSRGKAFF
jgi:hypothetical protein